MEETNERNDVRGLCTVTSGIKAGVQPRTSCRNDRDNNLIGSDRPIMARWKQDFYDSLNSKDDMEIRVEELMYEGPEVQIEYLTRDEVWEVIRALTFRPRASSTIGQAFHYSPENAFYIFNQQIYLII